MKRNARNRKTIVFGSSITRSINKKSMNDQLLNGSIDVHTFSGKTARYITKYMLPHLEEDCPHTVVLVAGGNDIPRKPSPPQQLKEIANHLIRGGLECVNNYGVAEVCISSILPRGYSIFQRNRRFLNNILRELCVEHGFTFIENDNIFYSDHIDIKDSVHLNSAGTEILTRNLLEVLNV